ncbi:MAG TPA: ABC transporter permease [Vicinamibacterales bacterium]
MSLWRQLTRGLRTVAHRDASDRDVADELQHYLDEATAGFVAEGMSPDAARLAARRRIGSLTAAREQVRSYGWENIVGAFVADLRYGTRRLRAAPAFTGVAVLTLAIGIGGVTAIFSAVNPLLFASLPYSHADRLAAVVETYASGGRTDGTFAMYRRFAERAHAFEAIAVFKPWQPTITGEERPERLEGQRVSAAYFAILGVSPVIGRDFAEPDDRPRGADVVILGDAIWRRRFNADPGVVGRPIRLDDRLFTVIGVMTRGFENVTSQKAELWAPLQYETVITPDSREWGHHLKTIARVRPTVPVAEATREVATLGHALIEEQHPASYDPKTLFVAVPLRDDLARSVKPALLAILGAIVLVLAIACVNLTNLLLARGARRSGEFALRAALGAARTRLIRQVLTESLLLALVGGAAGVLTAMWGVKALLALAPPGLPRTAAIAINVPVLIFAGALTTIVGFAFGMIPALQAARNDPREGMQRASPRSAGGHLRMRRALVMIEVALACVLLVSSGLLLRSLQRLFEVQLGFDSAGLVTMQVGSVGRRYATDQANERLYEQQLEAVRRVPGVVTAGFTSQLPLSGDRDQYGVHFDEVGQLPQTTIPAFRYAVSPGYLEAARIPLLAGRSLDEHDVAGAPHVALISESLAKARFGSASPIDQTIKMGPYSFTIVGVVGDVRQVSLALDNPQAYYINAAQSWFPDRPRSLVVRAQRSTASLVPAIEEAIWSVDRDQPITRVAPMDDLVQASEAQRRFALILFEAFGMIALALATVGIYGVLASSVVERTREIGVRLALGASRGEIVSLVMRQAMTMSAAGVVIGGAGAVFASRALQTLLFGVTPRDPATYGAVVALLLAAAAVAAWLPACRAARIDPAVTLRSE